MAEVKNTRNLQVAATTLPVLHAVVSIFITYKSVKVFLLSSLAALIIEAVILSQLLAGLKDLKTRITNALPFMLIFIGSIGMIASVTLIREKLELLKDPNHVASCSISPIVACSPVINSPEAETGGIPNPIYGVFSFGAFLIAGMSMLAGAKFAKWWWQTLWAGSFAGFAFVLYLVHGSVFEVKALCIYCMVTWTMVIPNFYYLTLYMIEYEYFRLPKNMKKFVESNHALFPLLTYVAIISLILHQFWFYWKTLI